MESTKSADEVEKKLKLQLLAEESEDCVCSKASEKSFLGWRRYEEQKEHKKRCETSRAGNQALLRREKTLLAATGDFLFRHYESFDRYMAQYRENHSTSCMERELNLIPILGVDVPDPYFPKIANSSALMERIKIIEALSDFYKLPKDANDVKNICLTGKKADPAERRYLPQTPKKSNNSTLPALIINSANDVNDVPCLPTVREGEDEEDCSGRQQGPSMDERCPEITKNDFNNCNRFENNEKNFRKTCTNLERESKPKLKESFVLPAAKLVCNESTDKEREYLRTTLPRIPLWIEYEPNKERQRKEMVLETLRIGKKCKASKKGSSSNETQGECLNLRSNLDTREGIPPPSRGNLRLGTTVRPATNQKDVKRKTNVPQTPQGRFDLHSNSYLSGSSHQSRKSKLPVETTFIKILGNQKVAPPKPSNVNTERKRDTPRTKIRRQSSSKEYQGIPLRYLRKFGRHNFNHVLEARSYKPETRKLGSTIIPN
ncbi:uncharacterized protein LOC116296355 isoform X2 [Actinia tenebrosa]|uniref:Uncharacterized protein LOC116296355 isoform X2 n=1 Tax=Actinia tenebrosa TaxID=6105 RepID=A0A6P8I679_ACTTE|nr:uncharacterized protein LOC116296355 isoform X2 [Actinia tenebrosa]